MATRAIDGAGICVCDVIWRFPLIAPAPPPPVLELAVRGHRNANSALPTRAATQAHNTEIVAIKRSISTYPTVLRSKSARHCVSQPLQAGLCTATNRPTMRSLWEPLLAALLASAAAVNAQQPPTMPLPWSAPLAPGDSGQGVYIAQNLLDRAGARPGHRLNASGTFDAETAQYVAAFQRAARLNESGVFDAPTATELLACCSDDGYLDDGVPPRDLGYLYKIHVRLFANRSIEVPARLIAANGSTVFEFTVRAHGVDGPSNSSIWPYYSSCCDGLTQFSDQGGNTPTGLAEADLNTPESNPVPYGPYPVNRMVRGLRGNARWLVTGANDYTTVRDGILMHTGQWSNHSTPPWAPPAPMVSAGDAREKKKDRGVLRKKKDRGVLRRDELRRRRFL